MTHKSSKAAAAAVIHKLRAYREAAQAINASIAGKVNFSTAELALLHLQLATLKDDIADYYKRCDKVQSRSQLTELECRYLCPAVSDMHVHFKAKRQSDPHSGRWIDSLLDVVSYANYWLGTLEAQYPDI